jgi:hypothetical protein
MKLKKEIKNQLIKNMAEPKIWKKNDNEKKNDERKD